MDWDIEKKKIITTYQSQYEQYGVNNRSLFVPGRKQNVRFNVIKEIGIEPTDSILDIGCGFGDLLTFLKNSIEYSGKYTGYDIIPEFIEVCQQRFPENDFAVVDILKDDVPYKWDYVVLSGTLNISIGDTHLAFIKNMIKKMFTLSKKGVSIDLVSIMGDSRYQYIYRADPFEIFNICKTLTKRIILRNDYMPYEFAIYMYKNDELTSDNIFEQYKFPEIISYIK